MSESELSIPDDFSFPYAKPYDIQVNFMKALYKTLELKKIGIFESPTGTGKSLSLLCGALTWLRDFKEKQKAELEKLMKEEDEKKKETSQASGFDWLTAFEQNFEKNQTNSEKKLFLETQVKEENSYRELKSQAKTRIKKRRDDEQNRVFKKIDNKSESKNVEGSGDVPEEELDLVLDDYFSDDDDDYVNDLEADLNKEQVTKIFFCSRTHSQLSQFVGELKKTKFAETTRLVTLGSRMNLCINDTVQKLNSLQLINDRCLELQKSKKNTTKNGSKKSKLDTSKACPYYKPSLYTDFSLKIMEDIFDIEDAVKAGHETKICPYYGSRYTIPMAELVTLSYNILLQKETRDSFSINLKNQIVIIDEAHNLLDTITQIHSIEITQTHITQSLSQLNSYLERYKSRLSPKNLLYCKQLVNILNGMNKCFYVKDEDKNSLSMKDGKLALKSSKLWTIKEFFTETKFYTYNFAKLLKFCEETKLEKKLIGFQEKLNATKLKENDDVSKKTVKKPVQNISPMQPQMKCPFMQIKQFLKVLTTPLYDGRVLLNIDSATKSSLKFILLNPNKCFEQIVNDAHAVILAGGTMKPISDFEHLIADKKRIEYYSCDHVIPKGNIMCIAIGSSSNNVKFDFSYNSRDNTKMLDELGAELIKICTVVPAGVVVFFASYDYLDKVMEHFKKAKNNFILDKIGKKKMIFFEPRVSSDCEKVFNDYTKQIKKCAGNKNADQFQDGAILFAVVGGKMSEGINFSDDLGRCVIVVGQPFANIKSLELQEKMQYLNSTQPKASDGRQAGQLYYEGLCWKAINQSIGRAIRHQNDYATILLMDSRYCTTSLDSMKEKLPKWICDSFKQENNSFNSKQIYEQLNSFYINRK